MSPLRFRKKRMDRFDEEAIIKYRALVSHYQQNKKDDIEVAENRRKLRHQSIEACYQAEELAALQDFEDKKSLLFDQLKGDIQKKISQLEDEMYAYQEKMKRIKEMTQKKRQPVHSRKPPSAKSRKKPVEVKGPYIVYMLKEEEIEEDLNIIRKALRTRELSPETQESDIEGETIHDYGVQAGSLNNKETNLHKAHTSTIQLLPALPAILKSNNNNNIHASANLSTPGANIIDQSNNLTKFSDFKKIPFLSPKKREPEIKYQNPISTNKTASINSAPLETPADTACQACLLESQSSSNQYRIIEEPVSDVPASEEIYCSCDVATSEIVYYSESHTSVHQEPLNSQPLNDLNLCRTQAEIVDYSESQSTRTLSTSYHHTPFTKTYQIFRTKLTKFRYFTDPHPVETVEIHTSPSPPIHVGDGWSSPSISNINNCMAYTGTTPTGTSSTYLPMNEKPEDLSVRKCTPDGSLKKRVYSPASASRLAHVPYYHDRRMSPIQRSPSFNEFESIHPSNNYQQFEITQSDFAENAPSTTIEISESIPHLSPKASSSSKEL